MDHIIQNEGDHHNHRIIIGTDSQSCLRALEIGQIRPYHYLSLDFSTTWKKIIQASKICEELTLHYVPAHVGIEGNELADTWAKRAVKTYTDATQAEISISLLALKAYIKKQITEKHNKKEEREQPPNIRRKLIDSKTAQIKQRITTPRPFQCLFTRYRCNRLESAGEYARTMHYVNTPNCRLCNHPKETIEHLLKDCAGTQPYRTSHNLTFNTLVSEGPQNIIQIAFFDTWLRTVTTFSTKPPTYRIEATVITMQKNRRTKEKKESSEVNPRKRQKLVIPDQSLNMNVEKSKIQRENWTPAP